MRCIAEYREQMHPPLLTLYIHDAPHRRMHIRVLKQYRQIIYTACDAIRLQMPIDNPIDLSVYFVDPSSPDLDNLLTALYQALDDNYILVDDGLIQRVTMMKLFPVTKSRHLLGERRPLA